MNIYDRKHQNLMESYIKDFNSMCKRANNIANGDFADFVHTVLTLVGFSLQTFWDGWSDKPSLDSKLAQLDVLKQATIHEHYDQQSERAEQEKLEKVTLQ